MIKTSNFSIELNEPQFTEIENSYNANTEIRVTLADDFCLTVLIATPENLKYLMAKDKVNFRKPGRPWIIIRKMTKEIIYEAVQGYMDASPDGFWLKMCYFASDFDNSVFDIKLNQSLA